MSHETEKQQLIAEGKRMGLKSMDIRVLSTDPYFVGTEKDYQDARWVADLWDNKMMPKRRKPLHIRGFHYWVQSQGIAKPNGTEKYAYVDPAKDWSYLLYCMQVARYLGIGRFEGLIDLKHPDPNDYDNYFVGSGMSRNGDVNVQDVVTGRIDGFVDEVLEDIVRSYSPRYSDGGYQTYHLEVMCEKNSMRMAIEPACKKYGACYQPFVGQASIEKINQMALRAVKAARNGKRVRLFYIADWDRYGWGMVSAVARKIEFMTKDETTAPDIKLARLALNDDHIAQYNLPKAPKHGEAVVELDALEAIHPGALGKLIEDALKPYYDSERPNIVREENRRIRELVSGMLDKELRAAMQDALADVDLSGLPKVDLTEPINPDFEVPEPEHEFDDSGRDWVLDSNLSYWEQLDAYKEYKDSRVEEQV